MKKEKKEYYENKEENVEINEESEEELNLSHSSHFNLKEEMEKRLKLKEENKISKYLITGLSSLPIKYFNNSEIEIEQNEMKKINDNEICTFMLGSDMRNGVYRITFKNVREMCGFIIKDGNSEKIKAECNSKFSNGIELLFRYVENDDVDILKTIILKYFDFDINSTHSNNFDDVYNIELVNNYDVTVDSLKRIVCKENITIELDLRSDAPYERNVYLYIDGYPIYTYFSGLPSVVRLWVYIFY